mgnify:FL=1
MNRPEQQWPIDPEATKGTCPPALGCRWIEVDEAALREGLQRDVGDRLAERLTDAASTWFASTPVFVPPAQLEAAREIVRSIWRVAPRLPGCPSGFLAPGHPRGVLFGFDFHLTTDAPRLAERNSKPGGVLLAARLTAAQLACCDEVAELSTATIDPPGLERALLDSFFAEWAIARAVGGGPHHGERPRSIAIVDADPPSQGLYAEMLLFRALFERAGVRAEVIDTGQLESTPAGLSHRGQPIDLVYNRSTDFELAEAPQRALRDAWLRRLVVVTPNPEVYLALADKRRLVQLSDAKLLAAIGVSDADRRLLAAAVPPTSVVAGADPDDLWRRRKELFFKPVQGYGSRGAYDGRKLTRRTFDSITGEGAASYLAQQRIEPSEVQAWPRRRSEGSPGGDDERRLKLDLRAVVYDGEVQFFIARLYRGQTTNLRTPGGGLATVFPGPEPSAGGRGVR